MRNRHSSQVNGNRHQDVQLPTWCMRLHLSMRFVCFVVCFNVIRLVCRRCRSVSSVYMYQGCFFVCLLHHFPMEGFKLKVNATTSPTTMRFVHEGRGLWYPVLVPGKLLGPRAPRPDALCIGPRSGRDNPRSTSYEFSLLSGIWTPQRTEWPSRKYWYKEQVLIIIQHAYSTTCTWYCIGTVQEDIWISRWICVSYI